MVLLNGVYFKGLWEHGFNAQLTRKESFYVNENEKVAVEMMRTSGPFLYGEFEEMDAKVVVLPYKVVTIVILTFGFSSESTLSIGKPPQHDYLRSNHSKGTFRGTRMASNTRIGGNISEIHSGIKSGGVIA